MLLSQPHARLVWIAFGHDARMCFWCLFVCLCVGDALPSRPAGWLRFKGQVFPRISLPLKVITLKHSSGHTERQEAGTPSPQGSGRVREREGENEAVVEGDKLAASLAAFLIKAKVKGKIYKFQWEIIGVYCRRACGVYVFINTQGSKKLLSLAHTLYLELRATQSLTDSGTTMQRAWGCLDQYDWQQGQVRVLQ